MLKKLYFWILRCGDFFNQLIKIKENYNNEIAASYGTNIGFLNDALYLYDHIPFLSGIRGVYQNVIYLFRPIIFPKSELDKIIKSCNVKMHDIKNFKLFNERTWN